MNFRTKTIRQILSVAAVALISATVGLAQVAPKLNNLIIYGDGFSFGAKEPDGWHGDTDKIASQYHVNVVFMPTGGAGKNDITIRIRINNKEDENTVEDLNYDMKEYQAQFPKAKFSDLDLTHNEYKTFAREVFVPGQFYEYVAYLNPGPGRPFIFSVAMSTKGEPATEDELKAYEAVLKSVVWLTASAPTAK